MVCQLTPPISGPSVAASAVVLSEPPVAVDEVGQPQHLPEVVSAIVNEGEDQYGCRAAPMSAGCSGGSCPT